MRGLGLIAINVYVLSAVSLRFVPLYGPPVRNPLSSKAHTIARAWQAKAPALLRIGEHLSARLLFQ